MLRTKRTEIWTDHNVDWRATRARVTVLAESDASAPISRIVLIAAIGVAALWLIHQTLFVLLFFGFAVILALTLNPVVTWLEDRGWPRVLGVVAVLIVLLAGVGIAGALMGPILAKQGSLLVTQLPTYLENLLEHVRGLFSAYPKIQAQIKLDEDSVPKLMQSVPTVLGGALRISFSVLGAVILALIMATVIANMLFNPRPLLKAFLIAVPMQYREKTARAFAKASDTTVAWIFSNMGVGLVEAVISGAFLSWMGVPGALLWALIAVFAELLPVVGFYVIAIPPTIVALSLAPLKGIWVYVFYLGLNEVMSNTVSPWLKGSRMNIHPVMLLFAMLMMGAAFGLMGALIATPICGFIKAVYDEFYLPTRPVDPALDTRVNRMLHRQV